MKDYKDKPKEIPPISDRLAREFMGLNKNDDVRRRDDEAMARVAHGSWNEGLQVKIPYSYIENVNEVGYANYYIVGNMWIGDENYVALKRLFPDGNGGYKQGQLDIFLLSINQYTMRQLSGEAYEKIYNKFLEKRDVQTERNSR